ncbi:MAG: hypothetical protein AAGA69_02625 [Pseudomonadota bacterium]
MSIRDTSRTRLSCAIITIISFLFHGGALAQETEKSGASQLVTASATIVRGVTVRSVPQSRELELEVSAPLNAGFRISHGDIDVEQPDGDVHTHPRIIAEFE